MPQVTVTYFNSLDIKSAQRDVSLIGHDISQLIQAAAYHMTHDETFACFTAPDGQVVALDKQSQFVMV